MYACVDYISYFLFLQLRLTMKSNANVDLLHEVHTVYNHALKHVSTSYSTENNKWIFDLSLPHKGEYSLNIFAKENGNDMQIFYVYTYIIESDGLGNDTIDGTLPIIVSVFVQFKFI